MVTIFQTISLLPAVYRWLPPAIVIYLSEANVYAKLPSFKYFSSYPDVQPREGSRLTVYISGFIRQPRNNFA